LYLLAMANTIGAERCGTCHVDEYQRWLTGPHAHAHESLTALEQRDGKCSGCHTMENDAPRVMFPGDTPPPLLPPRPVECEACHGPGRYYHPEYVMRDKVLARAVGLVDVTEAHCRRCHTPTAPSVEPFDFERFWARIAHGRKAPQTRDP
jgi:hypothetical protein